MFPPDDNNQNQGPSWMKALQAGAAGVNGYMHPGQQPMGQPGQMGGGQMAGSPGGVGGLAQAAGQLGQGIQQHRAMGQLQRPNPAVGAGIQQAIGSTPQPPMPAPPSVKPPPTAPGGMVQPQGDSTQPKPGSSPYNPAGGSSPYNPSMGSPMSDGRIVTKPTLAVLGEKEPEAVVPLSYRANARVRPSMAMPKLGKRISYR